jgi:hypothetical protein
MSGVIACISKLNIWLQASITIYDPPVKIITGFPPSFIPVVSLFLSELKGNLKNVVYSLRHLSAKRSLLE